MSREAGVAGQCCGKVYVPSSNGWPGRYKPCSKAGKVERDGKPYCGTHDPVRKAEREAAKSAAWNAEREEREQVYRLHRAAPDLLAALEAMVAMHETGVVSLGTVRLARAAIAKAKGLDQAKDQP